MSTRKLPWRPLPYKEGYTPRHPTFPTWQHCVEYGAQGNSRTSLWLEWSINIFPLQYHPGFGSEISTEALPGALPKGQVPLTSTCAANWSLHHLCFCVRTTLRCVHTASTVSSCRGRHSLHPGRPTRGHGSIGFDPPWSTPPSLLCHPTTSQITSITGLLIQTRCSTLLKIITKSIFDS